MRRHQLVRCQIVPTARQRATMCRIAPSDTPKSPPSTDTNYWSHRATVGFTSSDVIGSVAMRIVTRQKMNACAAMVSGMRARPVMLSGAIFFGLAQRTSGEIYALGSPRFIATSLRPRWHPRGVNRKQLHPMERSSRRLKLSHRQPPPRRRLAVSSVPKGQPLSGLSIWPRPIPGRYQRCVQLWTTLIWWARDRGGAGGAGR